MTFEIAIWVAQINLGDRALGRAQKSGNSSFLKRLGQALIFELLYCSLFYGAATAFDITDGELRGSIGYDGRDAQWRGYEKRIIL